MSNIRCPLFKCKNLSKIKYSFFLLNYTNHCVIFSLQRPALRLKNALLLFEFIGKN